MKFLHLFWWTVMEILQLFSAILPLVFQPVNAEWCVLRAHCSLCFAVPPTYYYIYDVNRDSILKWWHFVVGSWFSIISGNLTLSPKRCY